MKIDRIIHTAGHSFRLTAGAPVKRDGRCFASLTLRHLPTCGCSSEDKSGE